MRCLNLLCQGHSEDNLGTDTGFLIWRSSIFEKVMGFFNEGGINQFTLPLVGGFLKRETLCDLDRECLLAPTVVSRAQQKMAALA